MIAPRKVPAVITEFMAHLSAPSDELRAVEKGKEVRELSYDGVQCVTIVNYFIEDLVGGHAAVAPDRD